MVVCFWGLFRHSVTLPLRITNVHLCQKKFLFFFCSQWLLFLCLIRWYRRSFVWVSKLWSKCEKQHWETKEERQKESGSEAKLGPVSTLLKFIKTPATLVTGESQEWDSRRLGMLKNLKKRIKNDHVSEGNLSCTVWRIWAKPVWQVTLNKRPFMFAETELFLNCTWLL